MTIEACETCRAILHLLKGSGVAELEPLAHATTKEEDEPEVDAADLMGNALEFSKRLVTLGKIKMAYAMRVPAETETKSYEGGLAEGQVMGLRMAFDFLRNGTHIPDPEPLKRVHHERAKSDLLTTSDPSKVLTRKEINRALRPSPPKKERTPRVEAPEGFTACEHALLVVLAQMRGKFLTRQMLSILSGYKMSGTFDTAIGALRREGYVTDLEITEKGLAKVGNVPPVPSGRKLLAMWKSKLDTMDMNILQAVIDHHHSLRYGITRKQLAEATHYKMSGSFDTSIGKLRKLQLISKGKTMVPNDLIKNAITSERSS